MTGRNRSGSAIVETAMYVPLLVLLLMGTAEIARVTYVYYQAQKAMYGIARTAATRAGANFCDPADPELVTIKNWALTGSSDGGEPLLNGLTPDLVNVRLERQESGSDILGECECSLTGCDPSQGGRAPDFIVVSIPDGLRVTVTVPYLLQNVIVFNPTVRVPVSA